MLVHVFSDLKRILLPAVICGNAFLVSAVVAGSTGTLNPAAWYAIIITIVIFILCLLYKPRANKYLGDKEVIPVCSYCGNVRVCEVSKEWIDVEEFICGSSDSILTHGICEECFEKEMALVEKEGFVQGGEE